MLRERRDVEKNIYKLLYNNSLTLSCFVTERINDVNIIELLVTTVRNILTEPGIFFYFQLLFLCTSLNAYISGAARMHILERVYTSYELV